MEGSSPWRVHAERKMNNPSCLIYGPQDARFEDQPLPLIEDPSDVIVRIAYVGIERSDVSQDQSPFKERVYKIN